MNKQTGTVLGGAIILAGTAIGGGMLALPVLTAAGGFIPAIVVLTLCWLFMAATGLLLMEVFLWSPKEVNIISMAKMTLGTPGKIVAWALYLFLFYSLTVAYISGGGKLVDAILDAFDQKSTPLWLGPLLFVGIFAPFAALGASAVDRVNRVLVSGLILSFLVFIVLGLKHIELNLLSHISWPLAFLATPVVFTSFGFQGTVPSITNYLGRDPFKVRKAILWGTFIPFLSYVIWEALILGVIPIGKLELAKHAGDSAVAPLKNVLHLPWLYTVGEFFAFFAIVTSFLGVTLGLIDFLSDGLKVKKDVQGKFLLSLLAFLPPLVFALFNPKVFIYALQYAGGLGCALLLGLLPILMVWRGRYTLKLSSTYSLFGGRVMLTILILFVLLELSVMVIKIY